jgi:hypothetical protein
MTASGYTNLLLNASGTHLTSNEREYLHAIVESTRRMKQHLASLSRIADYQELNVSRCNVIELLRQAASEANCAGIARQIAPRTTKDPVFVLVDQDRLRENLHHVLTSVQPSEPISLDVSNDYEAAVLTIPCRFEAPPVSLERKLQRSDGMSNLPVGESGLLEPGKVRPFGGTITVHDAEIGNREVKITMLLANRAEFGTEHGDVE